MALKATQAEIRHWQRVLKHVEHDLHACSEGMKYARRCKTFRQALELFARKRSSWFYWWVYRAREHSAPALKAWNEAVASADKAYNEAVAPALKAYDEAVAPARKAYSEAVAPARKAFDEAVAPALKAFDEAVASAHKACIVTWAEGVAGPTPKPRRRA